MVYICIAPNLHDYLEVFNNIHDISYAITPYLTFQLNVVIYSSIPVIEEADYKYEPENVASFLIEGEER